MNCVTATPALRLPYSLRSLRNVLREKQVKNYSAVGWQSRLRLTSSQDSLAAHCVGGVVLVCVDQRRAGSGSGPETLLSKAGGWTLGLHTRQA